MSQSLHNQQWPLGHCRNVLDAIAATSKAADKREAIAAKSGYHPWGAYEAMQDGAKFEEWFAKLPDDLTDVDLSLLYLLAVDNEQMMMLRRREDKWQPDPDNPSEHYNGPIGQDQRPHHRNAEKWMRAVVKKEEAYRARFAADIELMNGGDVPVRLKEAANALVSTLR